VKFGDAALMCGCVHSVQSCRFISNGAAVEQQLDCMRFEGLRTMTLKNVCFWDVTQYIYAFISRHCHYSKLCRVESHCNYCMMNCRGLGSKRSCLN
jgi:hypothetical protein